jgi:glycine amidinotransferase
MTTTDSQKAVVNSWNEWDPLKRVILGVPDGSVISAPEPAWQYHCPRGGYPLGQYGPFGQEDVAKAAEQMDAFQTMLENRGIIVDRAVPIDFSQATVTPDWVQPNMRGCMPSRDVLLTVGNEILECTMSMRARYLEYLCYRPLLERYFKEDPNFLWTSAPKPRLSDESYVKNYYYLFDNVWTDEDKKKRLNNWTFHLTEKEPLFDAADGTRCGKDIFWQASAVTNQSGMDWLKRYFGAKGIRVHHVLFDGHLHPWHIDVNLIPLRPGLAVYNPEWPAITEEMGKLFKMNDWELIPAAKPMYSYDTPTTLLGGEYQGTSWISMNTLSLDQKTICVEAHETNYMEQLDKRGFEVIPVPYEQVLCFGGGLHCGTADVYREGDCENYFPKQIEGY